LNRVLLSVVWYGVQAVFGGKMVYVLLRSIWPTLDSRIPNTLPNDIGITSAQFVGYFLFNLISCGFIWLRPHQLRSLFHVTVIVVAVTFFALLGWALGTSDGWGDIANAKSTYSGGELGWKMLAGIVRCLPSSSAGG
jgi:NCS1 family nucleobase:cation symporter-1